MLQMAVLFLVVGIIAAVLGFTLAVDLWISGR